MRDGESARPLFSHRNGVILEFHFINIDTMAVGSLVLSSMLLGAMQSGAQLSTFASPRGAITFKQEQQQKQSAGKLTEGVRALTAAELNHVRRSALKAKAFVEKYVPAAQRKTDTLANLDHAFAAWLDLNSTFKETPAEVEAVVGAAFGQYCVAHLGLRWMMQSDAQGTEYALVGEQPFSKSFPLAAVRYRIEDGKTDFIGALYEALAHLRAGGKP